MRRFAVGVLVLVSAVSIVLASASLWTRHHVINTQVFVSDVETMVDLPEVEARINDRVTTTVMTNPQVRDAIDEAVGLLPPRLQQFKPSVESGIRSIVSAGVQRLLTNDPFRPLTSRALTTAHDQLVNGQPVQFTLGMAKDLVPAAARDGIAGQVLGLIPNDVGVTILTPADAPQVYTAVDLLRSAWWWLGLLSLACLAGALGVSRRRRGTLRAWAVTTAVLTLLLLATLRVTRGILLPRVRPENRDAVGAIYDVVAGSLRSWTLWLLAVALLVLVLTLIWGRLGLVAGVRRGFASARAAVAARQQARADRAAAADGLPAPAEGAAPAGGVSAGSTPESPGSVPQRVTAWARGFAEGLDLPERADRLGSAVRPHLAPARWAGISFGVLLLLLWPEPTLSVLIWVAALVGAYLGALAWLVSRAPEGPPVAVPAQADVLAGVPVPRDAVNGAPVTPVALPALVRDGGDPATEQRVSGSTGSAAAQAAALEQPAPATAATEPFVPAALTPETMTALSDRLDLLVRLGAAREAGVLTEEEFRREKGRLLGV